MEPDKSQVGRKADPVLHHTVASNRESVLADLRQRAKRVREQAIRMAAVQGQGYVGQALGVADVLAVAYFASLHYRPEDPDWEGRDRFLLSIGHYAIALYAVLIEAGILPLNERETYGSDDSRLPMSGMAHYTPGMEITGGSLGHGLPIAIGMCLGLRRKASTSFVYTLLSDGELNEGATWEAAMSASHWQLGNRSLPGIIDAARARARQKAVRVQYGETMLALAAERDDFIVLTADLMFATGMDQFGAIYPDRMINLGIAEQNMTGVAAGLALCGKLPVVCGYAAFTSLRATEQAKLDAAYHGVKIILTGQSAGLSYGVGGPTHQTYEDVAIMRAIAGMIVLVPSDPVEVDACLRSAMMHPDPAPIYIRLGRGLEYIFNHSVTPFEIGRAVTLRDERDLCLVANGAMVFEALLAAEALASLGILVRVINVHTVKPLDIKTLRAAAAEVPAMMVIEEHSRIGGLGAAVLEALDEVPHGPIRRLGLADQFPPIGPPHALRDAMGLSAQHIAAQALDLLGV
jgi:transketolase